MRERREDIPLLVRHFMERAAKANRKAMRDVDEEAQALLMGYGWPGNVRELQNMMERVLILGGDGPLTAAELPECVRRKPLELMTPKQLLLEMHLRVLEEVIERSGGNNRKAAEMAGIHYKSFHRAVKRARQAVLNSPPF